MKPTWAFICFWYANGMKDKALKLSIIAAALTGLTAGAVIWAMPNGAPADAHPVVKTHAARVAYSGFALGTSVSANGQQPSPTPDQASVMPPTPALQPATVQSNNKPRQNAPDTAKLAVRKPAPTPTSKPTAQPAAQPTAKASSAPNCSGDYLEQFICLLNQYRASHGKGKLAHNGSLASVAAKHSQWMKSSGTLSHIGEGGSSFNQRCADAGVSCRAENLAHGAGSAQNLLNMWKNSAAHNANLLGPYSSIGLGISGSYTTALMK